MNTTKQQTVKVPRDCDREAYPFCEHAVTGEDNAPRVNKYRLTFTGRTVGAIGKFQRFTVDLWADNEEQANLALYETHEHISNLQIDKLA